MAANSNWSASHSFDVSKSIVDAKVDGKKALVGLSIGYYVARSCPTTLLEPAFLRAVNAVRGRKPFGD